MKNEILIEYLELMENYLKGQNSSEPDEIQKKENTDLYIKTSSIKESLMYELECKSKSEKEGTFIYISEDGKDFFKDKKGNMVFFSKMDEAANWAGMTEVDGYICEIKYHFKE